MLTVIPGSFSPPVECWKSLAVDEERPRCPLPCLCQEEKIMGRAGETESARHSHCIFFPSCMKAGINPKRYNSCYNKVGKTPSPDSASEIWLKEEVAAFESTLSGEDGSDCSQNQTQRQNLDQPQVTKSD